MTPTAIQYASARELEALVESGNLSHEQKDAVMKRLFELLEKAEA